MDVHLGEVVNARRQFISDLESVVSDKSYQSFRIYVLSLTRSRCIHGHDYINSIYMSDQIPSRTGKHDGTKLNVLNRVC